MRECGERYRERISRLCALMAMWVDEILRRSAQLGKKSTCCVPNI